MKKTATILISLLLACQAWAQFDAGINFLVLSPEEQFNDNVKNMGYGGSLQALYTFPETPFSVGLNIGGANYGSETRSEILVWPVSVDVTTSNNMFFMHLMGRVEKDFGIIKPYAEFLFGFNNLTTESKIEDQEDFDEDKDDIASNTHLDDTALSYGLGGGLKIKIWEFEDTEEVFMENSKLYLDFKVRYMFGGEAEYLKEGGITKGANNEVILNPSFSETDFISYHIGVSIQLF